MNSRWGTSLAIPSTPEGIHEWQPKTRLTVLSAWWWLVSHQGKAKSPCGAHHGKRPQALGVFFHFSSWFPCEVGIYYPHLTDKEIRLDTQEPASQHRTNKQPDWGCSWHQPSDGSWSGVSQHLIKKLCKHTKSGPSPPPRATALHLGHLPASCSVYYLLKQIRLQFHYQENQWPQNEAQ